MNILSFVQYYKFEQDFVVACEFVVVELEIDLIVVIMKVKQSA
jgi:hypothetical protein